MSESEGYIRFEGKDASEAEEFIRSINIKAFTTNKSQDDQWIAMLAGTAFTGRALRWYRTLSNSVRNSWEGLQNALLEKYQSPGEDATSIPITYAPPSSGYQATPDTTIPTAPPAAGPPPPGATSLAQPRTGRIKTKSQSSIHDGAYLCGDLSIHGVYTLTRDLSKALTVRHSPDAQSLETLVGGGTGQCYLGGQFWFESVYADFGKGKDGYLELTPIRATGGSFSSSLKQSNGVPARGEILLNFWDVGSNGTLFPHVSQHGVCYRLSPCIFNSTLSVGLTSDFVAFSKLWMGNQHSVEEVELLFEPL